jgi:predicted GH43/DUF377 family glycosyl hydrolase
MAPTFARCPENPIVVPGHYGWRMATVFNPGVIYDEGQFCMVERVAGGLCPFHGTVGMLERVDSSCFIEI